MPAPSSNENGQIDSGREINYIYKNLGGNLFESSQKNHKVPMLNFLNRIKNAMNKSKQATKI